MRYEFLAIIQRQCVSCLNRYPTERTDSRLVQRDQSACPALFSPEEILSSCNYSSNELTWDSSAAKLLNTMQDIERS
jgi:hypothetical protein